MTIAAAVREGAHLACPLTFYPCQTLSKATEPLVLLHGWGSDSQVWERLLPHLCASVDVITLDLPGFGQSPPCASWEDTVQLLAEALPEKFFLLGWSLGGMLAARLADRFPDRIVKLVTLAANASFVCRPGWREGLDEGIFASFYQLFVDDPDACLRQFNGLQAQGDREERAVRRWFKARAVGGDPGSWSTALDWLQQLDNREILPRLSAPCLHLFGEGDRLVPVDAAAQVAKLAPSARIEVLEGSGHAPMISSPETLAALCLDFLLPRDDHRLHKQQIASSFSKAAVSYDLCAHLQRQVGRRLMAGLPAGLKPQTMVDMGCGTGQLTAELAERFPEALCLGIDLAQGMLEFASRQESTVLWFCADAESPALMGQSVDLIYSNFTFQWCHHLHQLMSEQFRLLRSGGWLAFTTVGPQSLLELRRAWGRVDDRVHVNRFAPLETIEEALVCAGFDIVDWRTEMTTRHYPQLTDLTGELKGLGAHNVNAGRHTGLTGKNCIARFRQAYESMREPQGLPASWEILYVVARKP